MTTIRQFLTTATDFAETALLILAGIAAAVIGLLITAALGMVALIWAAAAWLLAQARRAER